MIERDTSPGHVYGILDTNERHVGMEADWLRTPDGGGLFWTLERSEADCAAKACGDYRVMPMPDALVAAIPEAAEALEHYLEISRLRLALDEQRLDSERAYLRSHIAP